MKITSKITLSAFLATAMSMSSFAFFEIGVKGERVWVNQADGVARCNNIEGFIDIAGIGEVKKSDVRKLIITDFAMDYLYKRNLFFDADNRSIFDLGTFADTLSYYPNLSELVIENLIDEYEGDNRKTSGATTKAAYEGNFYALFWRAQKNLDVTIENINLSKTNLKNIKGNFVNKNRTLTRIMSSGLVSVNISNGKSWTEDIKGREDFNFSGNSVTLTNFSVDNLRLAEVTSLAGMFNGCTRLTNFSVDNISVPSATSCSHMFNGCTALTNFSVKNLSVPKVSSFGHMFNGCTGLTNCSINSLNAASAEGFRHMFNGCTSLTNFSVDNFNAVNAEGFGDMFNGCIELTDFAINNWNIQNISNLNRDHMFNGCPKLSNFRVPSLNNN